MSDPTYNRKQGVQKYWAMFQRERRKRLEDNLKIRACQVPPWDYGSPFYPQLEAKIQLKQYTPACAVFSEMFSFMEALYFKCDTIENAAHLNTRRLPGFSVEKSTKYFNDDKYSQFRNWFILEDLGQIVGIIKMSDNITYMEKVRLGNVFPDQLTEKEFEQWGVADKFPKLDCSLYTSSESPWCDYAVFKQYYDQILTLLEYVDTTCHAECEAVEIASRTQSAAFRNYIDIKRDYADIMSKIKDAVELRTAEGINESKTINDWSKEFGFGVDASYELLYDVVSTDRGNYDHVCFPGEDCVSSEHVQLELATSINPQNVSLSELENFVGKTLRSSIEGVAARSLAGAEQMTALRRTLAGLTMSAFAECRSEFTSFINVWKQNYCITRAGVVPILTPLQDLQDGPLFQIISQSESDSTAHFEHQLDSFNADHEKAGDEVLKIKLKPNNPEVEPLRRIWTRYREELRVVNAAREAQRKQEELEAQERAQERQAELIVNKFMEQERRRDLLPPPPGLPPRVDPVDEQDLDKALADGLISEDEYAMRLLEVADPAGPPRAPGPRPLLFDPDEWSDSDEEESKEELNPREEKDDIGGYRGPHLKIDAAYDNGYFSDHGF